MFFLPSSLSASSSASFSASSYCCWIDAYPSIQTASDTRSTTDEQCCLTVWQSLWSSLYDLCTSCRTLRECVPRLPALSALGGFHNVQTINNNQVAATVGGMFANSTANCGRGSWWVGRRMPQEAQLQVAMEATRVSSNNMQHDDEETFWPKFMMCLNFRFEIRAWNWPRCS